VTEGSQNADVVICGAGIAGIAAAYFLTQRHGIENVVIVDDQPPLSVTSDKSSEAYRNWWPGPGSAMVSFMDRSIDLLQMLAAESDNRFHLNRRGYLFVTADDQRAELMAKEARQIAALGAGPLRVDGVYARSEAEGYDSHLVGADLIRDTAVIQDAYPFLSKDTVAMLHARRCGWLSAQQLGMYMWEQARAKGARLLDARVTGVITGGNQVKGVDVQNAAGNAHIPTGIFVNAAGPFLAQVASFLGVELPVYNELHGKIAFEDTAGVVDRGAPLIICSDPVRLPWSESERADLAAFEDTSWLLDEFPPGLHFRPEGGPGSQTILALWPYHITTTKNPVWPLTFDPEFVEVVMRGLSTLVPGFSTYLQRMSPPTIDGGYYCKTRDNRPLISPLAVSGAFVIGALSGYGIMAAPAAAELLSAYIVDDPLPAYAPAFALERFHDPAYQEQLADWDAAAGQL
jgi:glycine/D-amino acid oxidase-like deaminating enzyme